MNVTGEEISDVVLKQFEKLPLKRKPQDRGNGSREWVPLSGVVAQVQGEVRCIALGSGMKCLPASKIKTLAGDALHDWHAEIVAIRSLNHFLLEECRAVAEGRNSDYVFLKGPVGIQSYGIRDDIKLHMYCSEAPCGDASMELTMAAQADPTPWTFPTPSEDSPLSGRGHFSSLGVVRRKPSRPDAPPTLSKSCSDKLAHAQVTSLLRSPACLVLRPEGFYLSSLTLPDSQYSEIGCRRAFSASGRMAQLVEEGASSLWIEYGYNFNPFEIKTTSREFMFSRRQEGDFKLVPSNLAAVWNPYLEETIIGGILQGRTATQRTGASAISKRKLLSSAASILEKGPITEQIKAIIEFDRYTRLKDCDVLNSRLQVKKLVREKALTGWVRSGGDDFELDISSDLNGQGPEVKVPEEL